MHKNSPKPYRNSGLFLNFGKIYVSRVFRDMFTRELITVSFLYMKHIVLPDNAERRLVFYLAMEEYVADNIAEDAFFLWRVGPTVIIGRNQSLEDEVDTAYCSANGVQVYRRKSGGGCVYADKGNLMISAVTGIRGSADAFGNYLGRLDAFLKGLGLDSALSGRNDILVEGRKVSGNALQMLPEKSIVHGTLLYDVDLEAMLQALRPPVEKLARHGISSVRQRVANLTEFGCGMKGILNMDDLAGALVEHFCDGTIMLTPEQVAMISEIEKEYLDPDFIAGGCACK